MTPKDVLWFLAGFVPVYAYFNYSLPVSKPLDNAPTETSEPEAGPEPMTPGPAPDRMTVSASPWDKPSAYGEAWL